MFIKKLDKANKEIMNESYTDLKDILKVYENIFEDQYLFDLENLEQKINYTEEANDYFNKKSYDYKNICSIFDESAKRNSKWAFIYLITFLGLCTFTNSMLLIYLSAVLTIIPTSFMLFYAALGAISNIEYNFYNAKSRYYFNLNKAYKNEELKNRSIRIIEEETNELNSTKVENRLENENIETVINNKDKVRTRIKKK